MIVYFCLFFVASMVEAQGPERVPPREGDSLIWHVVKPGETLSAITAKYLGYQSLWRENLRLNPQVVNPNYLRIGQRLRIIEKRRIKARNAELVEVNRRVDQRRVPRAWERARVGNLLAEGHALRTFKRSSAGLLFDDGTDLQVSEDSLIVLRQINRSLVGVTRQTIEIKEGQADFYAKPKRRGASEIEIIMGETRAKPKPDGTGLVFTRTRKEAGGSQVMVFRGSSRVEASGATVEVPKGMGTVVADGQAPSVPEPLLPAPKKLLPAADVAFDYANPLFSWQPVVGAVSYTLEVFAAPGAAHLAYRRQAISETRFIVEKLPRADLFWRITAVKASGLDGFPSKSRPVSIRSTKLDRLPPVVVLFVVGSGAALASDRVVLGRDGALRLDGQDDASGVSQIRYRWDGGSWRNYKGRDLRPPDRKSTHRLEFQARDELERWSSIWSVQVDVDETGPPAPSLQR